jgi:hypothetical protein
MVGSPEAIDGAGTDKSTASVMPSHRADNLKPLLINFPMNSVAEPARRCIVASHDSAKTATAARAQPRWQRAGLGGESQLGEAR